MTNLYDALELDCNASQEAIRKAYKKRALQTHPDKLPPDVPEEQKQSAHEEFVIVNHAYEVLIEPKNRQLYDKFGVWPPPVEKQESASRGSHRHDHEEDNTDRFDSRDFFRSPPFPSEQSTNFAFTDPFELFDKLMKELNHRSQGGSFDPFFMSSTSTFATRAPSRVHRLDPFASFSASFHPSISPLRTPLTSYMLDRPGMSRRPVSRSIYEAFDDAEFLT
ncbi:DnaJ-domain-containing protein [Obba rivulosa]|uniref:DnaJ-domain-containing protein n=1 Tax=Obba rivulosa TaxID=1052685 RepID=A0A8E2DRI3_9APHY|nr:DnaJ-domain-containing protein [Obba rivulosa]